MFQIQLALASDLSTRGEESSANLDFAKYLFLLLSCFCWVKTSLIIWSRFQTSHILILLEQVLSPLSLLRRHFWCKVIFSWGPDRGGWGTPWPPNYPLTVVDYKGHMLRSTRAAYFCLVLEMNTILNLLNVLICLLRFWLKLTLVEWSWWLFNQQGVCRTGSLGDRIRIHHHSLKF